ncbi:NAD(P)-binding protein [Ascodesmis nigricans]|uniref:NAD(P)-binding protein n=1 Tax=Ascodesmis nigricans TaxID=341454 RepID=A0A4S2MJA0_9PEZI|nr:NAD(P)-binding protein [Ascodesmis nigricans]
MDPVAEIQSLRFTPRTTAWKHVQKFEKLLRDGFHSVSDSQKWSMFANTIPVDGSSRNAWSGKSGPTPHEWLQDLKQRWIHENPPCEDANCHDCANDTMSYDYLKSSFLDFWGGDDRPSRRPLSHGSHSHHNSPTRSFSLPPRSSIDSSSDTESTAPTPRSLVAHSRVPSSVPTPPEDPVSEPEIVETKTSISINTDSLNGGNQIVLSISDNKKKPRRTNTKPSIPLSTDSGADDSRPSSPADNYRDRDRRPHPRAIEAPPRNTQIIDAAPPHALDLYHPSTSSTTSTPSRPTTPPPPPLRPRLLEGKIIAITGSSRGIGRALALGFAREGAHIIAHYYTPPSSSKAASSSANEDIISLCVSIRSLGQSCTLVSGDISDPQTSTNIIAKALDVHGRLDIAVSNAGICGFAELLDVDPATVRRHVEVNYLGAFWFLQAAGRQFRQQWLAAPADERNAEYAILAIASPSAGGNLFSLGAGAMETREAHFSATQAAVRELVRSAAVGLAKYGVRCNTLAPGITQTGLVREVCEETGRRRWVEERTPGGRVGVPGDVVGMAVGLVSSLGRWVSGQEVRVDGGASAVW